MASHAWSRLSSLLKWNKNLNRPEIAKGVVMSEIPPNFVGKYPVSPEHSITMMVPDQIVLPEEGFYRHRRVNAKDFPSEKDISFSEKVSAKHDKTPFSRKP